ncbi:MAG: hypothetical protein E7378_02230 [Clostridiales bacterium]|nr:hypothetical protein [Clostridiales bacterium]
MLFETLNQTSLLVKFLVLGFLSGLFFDVGNFIKFLFANKKLPCVIIDFLCTILCLLVYFWGNLKFNYGQLRFYPLLIFFTSFIFERFTLGKIIAKIYLVCYNQLNKLKNKIKEKLNRGKTNKKS